MVTNLTALSIIRSSLASRLALWFLLLLLLNLSIDPPDSRSAHIAEDLTVNEIESILELVLEEVCAMYCSVPESDESDEEKNIAKVRYDLFGQDGAVTVHLARYRLLMAVQTSFFDSPFLSGTKPEIASPPPEASV